MYIYIFVYNYTHVYLKAHFTIVPSQDRPWLRWVPLPPLHPPGPSAEGIAVERHGAASACGITRWILRQLWWIIIQFMVNRTMIHGWWLITIVHAWSWWFLELELGLKSPETWSATWSAWMRGCAKPPHHWHQPHCSALTPLRRSVQMPSVAPGGQKNTMLGDVGFLDS